jgi:acyl-CoA dehydrogenase
MAWDFSTDSEFQAKLDWAAAFVRAECEPLDLALPHPTEFEPPTAAVRKVIDPLKQQVRDRALWACHLGADLGGQGYGQVKLALLNEILGRSSWAPVIFGTQAPDTGNAEILAHYGTAAQKERFLAPLLDGEVFSCYSMTEPHAGSDPKEFRTRAWTDGDEWVIEGEKFFSSNARNAAFLIVMAVTDPDAAPYERMSMFLVPAETPGIIIERNIPVMGDPAGSAMHALIRYDQVRIPAENLLGDVGGGFRVAQTRLGGGRIHHAMRTVAKCQQALDLMCERALSRRTQGTLLAEKQLVQVAIADSWTQLSQLRLMVLHTAWMIDQNTSSGVRKEIAACKVLAANVLHDIVYRAMHVHGALGVTDEMPFARMWQGLPSMGIVDGPTEVHQVTIARQLLKDYAPADGLWPNEWLPPKVAAAKQRYADAVASVVAAADSLQ